MGNHDHVRVSMHTGSRVASRADNRYDGDTGNNNVNMSEESKEGVKKFLSSIRSHIDFNNNMIGTPLTDIPKRVIYNMTGD